MLTHNANSSQHSLNRGEELAVQANAVLSIKTGGRLELEPGAVLAPFAKDQAGPIADVPTGAGATVAANAVTINAILAALRGIGAVANT